MLIFRGCVGVEARVATDVLGLDPVRLYRFDAVNGVGVAAVVGAARLAVELGVFARGLVAALLLALALLIVLLLLLARSARKGAVV